MLRRLPRFACLTAAALVAVAPLLYLPSPSLAGPADLTSPTPGQAAPHAAKAVAPPAAATEAWQTVAFAGLAEREYHFGTTAKGQLEAPNRAQDLRVQVDGRAFTLAPRTDAHPRPAIRLALRSLSRGVLSQAITDGVTRAVESRAEIVRAPLGLTEWVINESRGVEHGVTLDRRLLGESRAALVLRFELPAVLHAQALDARGVELRDASDAMVLRYDGLVVRDADGAELNASIAPVTNGFEIRVDDANASYPVTIDPLATTPAWTGAGATVNTDFGYSVATAGDVNGDGYSDVIVGAVNYDAPGVTNSGAAFIFHGGSGGLSASPNQNLFGDQTASYMGASVACAGDVNGDGYSDVIVGAPFYDAPESAEGRAYLYLGSSGGIGAAPVWTAEPSQVNWQFGFSVASAGDVNGDGLDDVLVGAPLADSAPFTDNGIVWLYLGHATLNLVGGTLITGPADYSYSGSSVSSAGDVNGDGFDDVIFGAPGSAFAGFANGSFRVLLGQSSAPYIAGGVSRTAGTNASRFGSSVTLAGDLNGDGFGDLLVGEMNYSGGQNLEGRAYTYYGTGDANLIGNPSILELNEANGHLGEHVACGGDINGDGYADVLVGRSGAGLHNEQVLVFFGSSTGTPPSASKTLTSTDAAGEGFSYGLATAGDVNGDGFSDVLVGAPLSEPGFAFAEHRGRAYLFLGGAERPQTNIAWSPVGFNSQDVMGWSVAAAGDVDADGFDDILVGAPGIDNGGTDRGRAYLYRGGPVLPAASPLWQWSPTTDGASAGISVASAGDVNGDGYADIIVGAHTENGTGRAYVFHGSASGPSLSPDRTYSGNTAAEFGSVVGSAGDINGDGYGDVFIGAPGTGLFDASAGYVQIRYGSPTGLAGAATTLHGEVATDKFGQSVSLAGDVNGDGYSDLIVGAPYRDVAPNTDVGRVYLFLGRFQGLNTTPSWIHSPTPQNSAGYGGSVAGAGDVNGDGYSDVAIGASGWDGTTTDDGLVEVYYGQPNPDLGATPDWTGSSGQAFSGYGASIASAGDVNADGLSDLLIGAVFFDANAMQDPGRVFLHYGTPAGLSVAPEWTMDGIASFANIGHVVAGGGDVNGDGYADPLFGEPGYSGITFRGGFAHVQLSNGGSGRARLTTQFHAPNLCIFPDFCPKLQPLDQAAGGTYYVRTRAISPKGIDRVRIAWETHIRATGFNGAGIGRGTFGNTFSPGFGLSFSSVGLTCAANDNPCHWRARLESRSPFFPRAPWFSPSMNAPTEGDVRTAAPVVGVDPSAPAPTSLAFATPFPNPTTGRTALQFELPRTGEIHVVVRDVQGRTTRTLAAGWWPAGRHTLSWDGRSEHGESVAPGVYFITLEAQGERMSQRVTVVK